MLPSTIDVFVSERRPFGLCRQGNQLYLVARDGTLMDEFGPRYAEFDLPIIDGLFPRQSRSRVSPASRPRSDRHRRPIPLARALAASVVDALRPRPELIKRVSQIDVSDVHDAVVLLDDDPALLHLGDERFRERLQSYLEIADALRARIPDIDYVDLRFEQRVYVKPRGRAGRHGDATASRWQDFLRGRRGTQGTVPRRVWTSGTSKVTAIVGEATDDGGLDIIGMGLADSRGIKRGVVVNLEAAVESIKKAIEEAELTAGVEIDSVHLGLSAAHVKAFNSRGVVAVAGKNREITREDVRRAIDAAKAVALPSGREILHVLPQDFVVDEQDGIGAPVGMTGARLEVNVHVVTGSASSTQNIVACVNRSGVAVLDTVLEQLAASDAVLTNDEKELGVALVDIGGGTTDFAIFERGSLWHTGVVAIGGDHFTNDIAVGLRTPIPDAERIKRRSGCALSALVDERRDDGGGQRRRPQAAGDVATDPLGDPAAARRRDLPSALGRVPARRLREVAQLGHRADRRRRHARGPGRGRRTDLRSADPARRAGRARRAGGSREQPGVCHRRRARDVRASESGGRAGAAGRRRRVRPGGRAAATLFKEFF